MFFNSTRTKNLIAYTVDVYFSGPTKNFYQMFGNIVLDLGEAGLVRNTAQNTKSISLNSSLKAALYFYIFMSKKAYCNYKATKAGINYSFKISLHSFNTIFDFLVKLCAEHRDDFISVRSLAARNKPLNFYLRVGRLLSGASLNESNDLFFNLYKDIRSKEFCIAAKFIKVSILF